MTSDPFLNACPHYQRASATNNHPPSRYLPMQRTRRPTITQALWALFRGAFQ